MSLKHIRLSEIVFDAGTQIRAVLDEALVAEYAERMTDGVQFPPVVVFTDGTCREDRSPFYYLADGFHRVQAAQRNQFRDIEADVQPGTKTDALWFALGANKANGLRLTEADKKHALKLAFQTWGHEGGKSTTQIAEQVGCALSYAQRIEAEVTTSGDLKPRTRVTGKDGKSYPASRPTAEPTMKMPDRSKSAVAQRRQDIRDMAERGYTTRQIASAIGVTEPGVAEIARSEDIVIHADRVVGRTRRHNANYIIERLVESAENLLVGAELIDFRDVQSERLGTWITSLQTSRKALTTFIRRLEQEHKTHGEAA